MRLDLNGIDVDCVIGERDYERNCNQRLYVDVSLELDSPAQETDSLSDTVDYAALTELVRETLVRTKCRMIERAARVVAEACMEDRRVIAVEVRVTKSGAIEHLKSAAAVVTLAR